MKNIKSKEFRHGIHLPYKESERKDTHVVAELITYEDDTVERNLKIIEDYKRPYYITKPYYQNHKQKKESEAIDKLNRYTATESDMAREAGKKLGVMARNPTYRDIQNNPYIYLASTTSLTLLKLRYRKKYPDARTPYETCFLDIENDVDTGEVTVISIIYNNLIYTVVNESLIKGLNHDFVKRRVVERLRENMPTENVSKENMIRLEDFNIRIDISNGELEALMCIFKVIHKLKPDILTAWNAIYDFEVLFNVCKKNDVRPELIFADPELPDNLKIAEIKKGRTKFKSEGKGEKGLDIQEQWHTYNISAHYVILDQMATYNFVRTGEKTIQGGFSLENVLNKELSTGKLKIKHPGSEELIKTEWHRFMSNNHPIDYVAYNIWDVIPCQMLEKKTADLGYALPLLSDNSTFDKFSSAPKRLMDDFFIHYLENGEIIGTNPNKHDFDTGLGLGDKQWIVTLDNWRTVPEVGYSAIEGHPYLHTNIRPHTLDLDMVSSYPSNTLLGNISKATTSKEIINISGVSKSDFIKNNMNILTGKVNALSYCSVMFNTPTLLELEDMVAKKYGL